MGHRYQPYYCEENVWHLVAEPTLDLVEPVVLFISNAARTCMLWHQRAAPEGAPVLWDYHVILIDTAAQPQVFDLDTTLGFPTSAERYFAETFAGARAWPASFRPLFRWVPAARFVEQFSSDRSHMVDDEGNYAAPPPSWPPIGDQSAPNLRRFIDLDDVTTGEVFDLAQLGARLGLKLSHPPE